MSAQDLLIVPAGVLEQSSTLEPLEGPSQRRVRRRRKRIRFGLPERPAIAVRALWESASEEEKKTAHHYAMAILESWTGRASFQETAARLSLPPVRVHQLSQQALSGLLAGLLVQPRTRRRRKALLAESASEAQGAGARLSVQPEDDPVLLRKKIRELEVKLSRTEDLVRVLRELPWHRAGAAAERGKEEARGKKPVPSRAKTKALGARPKTERKGEADAGSAGAPCAAEGA